MCNSKRKFIVAPSHIRRDEALRNMLGQSKTDPTSKVFNGRSIDRDRPPATQKHHIHGASIENRSKFVNGDLDHDTFKTFFCNRPWSFYLPRPVLHTYFQASIILIYWRPIGKRKNTNINIARNDHHGGARSLRRSYITNPSWYTQRTKNRKLPWPFCFQSITTPSPRVWKAQTTPFNGSEASFHGFPAHMHSLLTDALAESHEVYTRIYPRYKSRGDMKIARDQFSSWWVVAFFFFAFLLFSPPEIS